MFWGRSYLFIVIGLSTIFFGVALTYFIPFLFCIPLFIMGSFLCLLSIILVHLRAKATTLDYLLDPDESIDDQYWLYIWGSNDIEVIPALRVGEKQTYNRKLDQQAKTFKTYRFAGHSVYIVPEGVGHSVDAGAGLYCQIAKDKWKVSTLSALRDLFKKDESKPRAKIYETGEGLI